MAWADKKILVIGGDQRLLLLADLLKNSFRSVQVYALAGADSLAKIEKADSLKKGLQGADIIVGPVPFTKDGIHILTKENTTILLTNFTESLMENGILFGGNIPISVVEAAKLKNIKCCDFMKMEEVALENAISTAEGAIAEAITLSPQNVNQQNCLVLGYGRCAKAIAQRLKGLNAKVTIAARKDTARKDAISQGYGAISLEELNDSISKEQFIFNTIPFRVLNGDLIEKVATDAVIIDIASSPGGTDFEACARQGIQAKLSLGIPGRFSPKTSAVIMLRGMMASLE